MINYAIHQDDSSDLKPMSINCFSESNSNSILRDFEKAIVSVTFPKRIQDEYSNCLAIHDFSKKNSPIEQLYKKLEELSIKRENILSLSFLWLRSAKKVELQKIEIQIDELERELLKFNRSSFPSFSELRDFIDDIQLRLEACIKS